MSIMDFYFNAMRSGGNPESLVLSFLKSQNTPMSNNLLQMAQQRDSSGIESMARNLCQQKGVDFDTEFKAFKQQFGFK